MGAKKVITRKGLTEKFNNYFDCVVITTNNWTDIFISLKLAATRGKIGFLGFPGRNNTLPKFNPFEPKYFYQKQLKFISLGNCPENVDSRNFLRFNEKSNINFLLKLFENKILKHEYIVTKQFDSDDILEAYNYLNNKKNSPITCLIKWI